VIFKVKITSEAQQDILEARQWYRSISPELGKRFIINARKAQEDIQQAPFAYSAIDDLLRSHNLSIFPYTYHYYIHEEGLIIITGLYHHSRNPSIWRKPPNEK